MPSPLLPSVRRVVHASRRVGHRIRGDALWYRDALRGRRPADDEVRAALAPGHDLAGVVGAMREDWGDGFPPDARAGREVVRALREWDPDWQGRTLAAADEIARGIVRLLGMDRVDINADAGGARFAWHDDVLNGYVWRPQTPARLVAVPYDRADIKVPWELSRFQHLPTLGMAHLAAGDDRYAAAAAEQVDDWLAANPPGYGVNWACTMDVAIRAVNLLWGLRMLAEAPALSEAFLVRALAGLLAHGRHISRNVERYAGGITTNHTLADYVGLHHLAVLLPWFAEARAWDEQARAGVLECLRAQVGPDGVDFENSIPYHRLVTEMLLDSFMLAEAAGRPFPSRARETLERMLDFTLQYVRPDGLAPLVGDSDDGRLRILSRYFEWQPQDHRHLLAVGAEMFDRDDFASVGRESADGVEEVAWLLGPAALRSLLARPAFARAEGCGAFRDSGRYVVRLGDDWALICADEVGTAGLGNHKHNDLLSFELTIDATPVVVDRGSYLYTSDLAWRDRFRSTRSHSTVMVDGQEQNRFAGSFGMSRDARVVVREWRSGTDADVFAAEHHGYRRLADPVTHARTIIGLRSPRAWVVADRLDAGDMHRFESFLQLAPGEIGTTPLAEEAVAQLAGEVLAQASRCTAAVELAPPQAAGALAYTRAPVKLLLVPLGRGTVAVREGWHAPRYGQRVPAPVVELSGEEAGATSHGFLLIPT